MTAALERVLADVKPLPRAASVWALEQQQQEAAFNFANAALQPAVYYSPDAYKALDALYAHLLQAIAASVPVIDGKKGGSASAPDIQLNCTAVTRMQSVFARRPDNKNCSSVMSSVCSVDAVKCCMGGHNPAGDDTGGTSW